MRSLYRRVRPTQGEVPLTADPPVSRFWPWAIVWAVLFAVAHTQAPEYYSNQHQYLLHGLANADVGFLRDDWLASTEDPTPPFSALVRLTQRLVGPIGFQVLYLVLLGTYFEAMRRFVGALPGFPDRGSARLMFLALFVAVHAAALRVASIAVTGVDYPWFLQAGLAAQYLLGPGLQPSAFGILLIVSLAAFANERPILAAGLAALAAVMHSTYILPAGLMVLGYLCVLRREGQTRQSWWSALTALAIVSPVLGYNARTFVTPDMSEQIAAQQVLAKVRIPHHAVIERWFDFVAMMQIGIMLVGLLLIRKSRLFVAILIPMVASAILSGIQAWTGGEALALLFPWRFSVVLMPVAVAVILAKLAQLVARREAASRVVAWGLGIALAAGGLWVTLSGRGYQVNKAEEPLLEHIRANKLHGEVYLLPVKFPTLKKESPASQSKTFAPAVRPGAVGIPVDLQRFRLSTGAPIYVDFKAVPYAPAEVLEWQKRVANCERWYAERDWDATGVIDEVAAAGITHIVATADRDVTSRRLERVYTDENYRVYRIR
jgi:hypothetical protein